MQTALTERIKRFRKLSYSCLFALNMSSNNFKVLVGHKDGNVSFFNGE